MIYMQSFRDADGKVVDSFKLTLFLSDFICKEYAARLLGCEEVVIDVTAEQLCDIYEAAVRRQIKENEMRSARAAAVREEDVQVEASHEEEAAAEAVREERPPVVVPQPENRSTARKAIQGVAQILRRSERRPKRAAA
jgi:hypothetical protein